MLVLAGPYGEVGESPGDPFGQLVFAARVVFVLAGRAERVVGDAALDDFREPDVVAADREVRSVLTGEPLRLDQVADDLQLRGAGHEVAAVVGVLLSEAQADQCGWQFLGHVLTPLIVRAG
jgi:hypothetical protein